MVVLAAYVRAAVNSDAPSTRGTIFSVLIGSRWFEVAGLSLTWVPAFALSSLSVAIGWRDIAGYVVTVLTLIVFFTTSYILTRLVPHTTFGKPAAYD
jgi:hypothetical protein